MNNFEQSKNTFLKKLIAIVKYKNVFLICIVSNYCRKTIPQIAVRQIVVNHKKNLIGFNSLKMHSIIMRRAYPKEKSWR